MLFITIFSFILLIGGIKLVFRARGWWESFFDNLIIIFIGFFLLLNNYSKGSDTFFAFDNGKMVSLKDENISYTFLFSKPVIDISFLNDTTKSYRVNLLFSNARIIQNNSVPLDLKVNGFLYSSEIESGEGYLSIKDMDTISFQDNRIKIKFKLYLSNLKIQR